MIKLFLFVILDDHPRIIVFDPKGSSDKQVIPPRNKEVITTMFGCMVKNVSFLN
ncbi:MAG: hypothetical protein OSB44_06940 [Verrucomicrobiales bacterium]|nr:hypothetical protein [Verrucomicrobiales bacterium]